MKKLFLVHCGFYDASIADGIYESHVNYFIAAADFEAARLAIKALPEYKTRKMHIDGLQEIFAVDGFRVEMVEDAALGHATVLRNYKHRELAPKSGTTAAN